MLLTIPVSSILVKNWLQKLSQSRINGARPLSGKAKTEFSRAELKSVSRRCTKGEEAESAMNCGT
ncbi:hypothetical protein FQZ97_450640 [compost metagenome]